MLNLKTWGGAGGISARAVRTPIRRRELRARLPPHLQAPASHPLGAWGGGGARQSGVARGRGVLFTLAAPGLASQPRAWPTADMSAQPAPQSLSDLSPLARALAAALAAGLALTALRVVLLARSVAKARGGAGGGERKRRRASSRGVNSAPPRAAATLSLSIVAKLDAGDAIVALAWSPDGRRLGAAAGAGARVWAAPADGRPWPAPARRTLGAPAVGLALVDGTGVAVASGGGVSLFRGAARAPVWTAPFPAGGRPAALAFDALSDTLAVLADRGDSVEVLAAADGRAVGSAALDQGMRGRGLAAAGGHAVVATLSPTLSVLSLGARAVRSTAPLTPPDRAPPASVAVAPGGAHAAVGSRHGAVRVFCLATRGRLVADHHAADVRAGPARPLALSLEAVATVSGGRTLILRAPFDAPEPATATAALDSDVAALAFSPDGARLAAGLESGEVVVFAVDVGGGEA